MELLPKIMKAVREGNKEALRAFLEQGNNANQECYGSTPLLAAVSSGYQDVVTELLLHGADPNFTASDSTTALVRAVALENKRIVDLLLSHKADPNGHISGYDTPLLRAIAKGYTSIMHLLLNYGADANYSIKRNSLADSVRVPLIGALKRMIAFSAEHSSEYRNEAFEMVKLLLDHNANPNVTGNYRECLYGILLRSVKPAEESQEDSDFQEIPLSIAVRAGEKELVTILLQYGAYIEGGGKLSEIPLHAAVDGARPEMVQELIHRGAFINSQDYYGQTAVHTAAYSAISSDAAYECLNILLSSGAQVNIQDYEGNTPLMFIFAYESSCWDVARIERIVKVLREASADVSIVNIDGKDAQALAQARGFKL